MDASGCEGRIYEIKVEITLYDYAVLIFFGFVEGSPIQGTFFSHKVFGTALMHFPASVLRCHLADIAISLSTNVAPLEGFNIWSNIVKSGAIQVFEPSNVLIPICTCKVRLAD